MGLLTERAARTLEASVGQVNPALHRWLRLYSGEHGPPRVRRPALRGGPHALPCSRLHCSCTPSRQPLAAFLRKCPLRLALQDGNWSDVSGENFLRTLLTK